jgi:hypothetical protein
MAKQIAGLCFLEGTFDELTFYKMEGKYYVRVKSSLTGKRVKTSPEFRLTMCYANLMGRASKIGSAIYKALPANWRQSWMYRSFTGEAFTLLKENPYTDEEVKQILWKTYVEYWEQWEAANATNPALPVIKAEKPRQIRKRRKYSLESLLRMKDKYGRPKFRNPEEEEKKRLALEKKRAWSAQQPEREEQQAALAAAGTPVRQNLNEVGSVKEIPVVITESKYPPKAISKWLVTSEGVLKPPGQTLPVPEKAITHHEANLVVAQGP